MKQNKDALLVIDMQNVYLKPNKWACMHMKKTIDYIENIIKTFNKEDIFFTQFIANRNDGTWNKYNEENKDIIDNNYLNDYVNELKRYLNDDNLYTKSTYSCLKNTELYNKLKSYDNVYVTGVVAECCVLSTIFDLIDMGKKVIYLKRGISSISTENEKSVLKILEDLSPLHILFK